jgi:hypothetical protein
MKIQIFPKNVIPHVKTVLIGHQKKIALIALTIVDIIVLDQFVIIALKENIDIKKKMDRLYKMVIV